MVKIEEVKDDIEDKKTEQRNQNKNQDKPLSQEEWEKLFKEYMKKEHEAAVKEMKEKMNTGFFTGFGGNMKKLTFQTVLMFVIMYLFPGSSSARKESSEWTWSGILLVIFGTIASFAAGMYIWYRLFLSSFKEYYEIQTMRDELIKIAQLEKHPNQRKKLLDAIDNLLPETTRVNSVWEYIAVSQLGLLQKDIEKLKKLNQSGSKPDPKTMEAVKKLIELLRKK